MRAGDTVGTVGIRRIQIRYIHSVYVCIDVALYYSTVSHIIVAPTMHTAQMVQATTRTTSDTCLPFNRRHLGP